MMMVCVPSAGATYPLPRGGSQATAVRTASCLIIRIGIAVA